MDDIKAHVADLIENAPAPQEHVISQHMDAVKEKNNIKDEFKSLVDREGLSFNPDLHVVNDDGSPSITSTGKLRRKTRVSQSKIESVLLNVNTKVENPQSELDTAKRKRTAMIITRMNEVFGIKIAGETTGRYIKRPEFDQDEELEVLSAVDLWLLETGNFDLPPNITLALVLGMYWFRIGTSEVAQNKLTKMGLSNWIKSKLSRKKKNDAYINSGNDRKRQDDAGKEGGESD